MDWGTTLLWLLAILLVVGGIAGMILPALPGPILLWAGLALAAWIHDFDRVGVGIVALLFALNVLAYVVDFVAGSLGAKKFGAGRQAVIGAALGAVVGIFFGLPGLILGPFVGAVLGEYAERRHLGQAGRAGIGAWVGFVLGVGAKLAIGFAMIGIFATAYLF